MKPQGHKALLHFDSGDGSETYGNNASIASIWEFVTLDNSRPNKYSTKQSNT